MGRYLGIISQLLVIFCLCGSIEAQRGSHSHSGSPRSSHSGRSHSTYSHSHTRSAGHHSGSSHSHTNASHHRSHSPHIRTSSKRGHSKASNARNATGRHRSTYAAGVARDKHGRIKRSSRARKQFMKKTGYPHGRKGYVIDHIVPLSKGGRDSPENMQWQTKEEARRKDKIERK